MDNKTRRMLEQVADRTLMKWDTGALEGLRDEAAGRPWVKKAAGMSNIQQSGNKFSPSFIFPFKESM